MKKVIFVFTLLSLMTSCCKEDVDFKPDNNYSIALDTLKNYSDYILGDFNGNFLISTNVHAKGYSASIISTPIDSSYIQFQLAYKLLDNNIEKSVFVSYRFHESKTKLNLVTYKYNTFSDFINFFSRSYFNYYQISHPRENIHNVGIAYQNFYDINNDINRFDTNKYNGQIKPNNFNFKVDSIKVVENPIKKVEVYYSFKCIGVNDYSDKFKMKNGKGKSTFEWQ
ncbi:hypothetical protein IRZ80_20695 [Flavobacterium sp. HJJ]|nr:hypothetical protein [Flavobacterium sp. HJJ]